MFCCFLFDVKAIVCLRPTLPVAADKQPEGKHSKHVFRIRNQNVEGFLVLFTTDKALTIRPSPPLSPLQRRCPLLLSGRITSVAASSPPTTAAADDDDAASASAAIRRRQTMPRRLNSILGKCNLKGRIWRLWNAAAKRMRGQQRSPFPPTFSPHYYSHSATKAAAEAERKKQEEDVSSKIRKQARKDNRFLHQRGLTAS